MQTGNSRPGHFLTTDLENGIVPASGRMSRKQEIQRTLAMSRVPVSQHLVLGSVAGDEIEDFGHLGPVNLGMGLGSRRRYLQRGNCRQQ